MRILVVDDSKAMRLIVSRTIRQAGFDKCQISEACNGLEGLKSIRASVPDLVLCDWNMPEMNGPTLLKTLNDEGIKVNFGFVTSESSPEFAEAAREAGALFLISKPFTPQRFKAMLLPFMQKPGEAA